ncbi:Cytochrome P450 3A40 [Takifugu flavidus]|uniref:Cytochrome P450 3A40 n=1 Tax=Takifugu flavidus TaxID=433684 RepID=A0A5C6MQY0_9TELE|nr:Cytochrome P450 3A40 [Takifugu flavidus]
MKAIFALSLGYVRGWRSKTSEHWSKNEAHAPASPEYRSGIGRWGSRGAAVTSCDATLGASAGVGGGACSARPKASRFVTLALRVWRVVQMSGIHHFDEECYKKYGKVWGLYDGRQPLMCIMDTGMIKTVLVKECYSNFTNRRDLGVNGPLSDAVSVAEDEQWKRIRGILSPSFTSGRLKEMYTIMLQHSKNLLNFLNKKVEADEVIDVKE